MRATLAMLNVCVTLAAPRRATYAPPSSDAATGPSHPAGSRGEYDISTSPSDAFAQNAADDAQTSKTRSCFFMAGGPSKKATVQRYPARPLNNTQPLVVGK